MKAGDGHPRAAAKGAWVKGPRGHTASLAARGSKGALPAGVGVVLETQEAEGVAAGEAARPVHQVKADGARHVILDNRPLVGRVRG